MASFYITILVGIVCLVSYLSISYLVVHVSRQRLIALHSCKPPPSLPQRDPFFGLDLVLSLFRSTSRNKRNVSIKSLFDRYGPTFASREWGAARIFSIEPANLRAVFSTDAKSWGVAPLRGAAFAPLIGTEKEHGAGVMASDGEAWERGRALLKPVFAAARRSGEDSTVGEGSGRLLELHVSRLLARLPDDGKTVDMQPLFARQALDSSTELLFGRSTATLSDEPDVDANTFLDAYNAALRGAGKRLQLPRWWVGMMKLWDGGFEGCCETARSLVESFVDEEWRKLRDRKPESTRSSGLAEEGKPKEKSPSSPPLSSLPHDNHRTRKQSSLAASLLVQTNSVPLVRDLLLNIFLPAHDANGILLTNVIFALARHPAAYRTLRHEILSHFPLRSSASSPLSSITASGLPRLLPYLHAVLRETLRLYPSVGTTARAALRDTVLPTGGGPDGHSPVLVRRGDVFATSFYALHRRPELWGADAEAFRPERWLKRDEEEERKEWKDHRAPMGEAASAEHGLEKRDVLDVSMSDGEQDRDGKEKVRREEKKADDLRHWHFLPFLAGPRHCPGQGFAITEVSYTLARIAQTFESIENRDPCLDFVESYKITTESKNGAKVAFKRAGNSVT